MDQKYVPSGVCLLCDKGTLPGRLTVSFNLQATIYGANLATESDKQPLLNITPMGVCAMSRMPCLPQPTQWLGLQNDVLVNGQRLLLEDSRLPCVLGGQIRISLLTTPPSLGAGLLDSLDASLATLGPVGDVLRTDLGIAEGVVGGVVALAEGVWSLAKLSAKLNMAVGKALLHPVDSAQSAWHGAQAAGEWASKGENWNKTWDASQEMLGKADQAMYDAQEWVTDGRGAAWASQQSPRDWGRLGGRGAFEAFMLVGTGGLGEAASTAGKVGKAASVAEKGVEAANLLEKGSEAASAAGRLARTGPVTNGAEAGAKVATEAGAEAGAKQAAKEMQTVEGAPKKDCTALGEPVDVATGRMFTEATDVTLPGPIPFVWARTWYSNSARRGPLGSGWHHSYDLVLWQDAAGCWYLRETEGRLVAFGVLDAANDFRAFSRPEQLELRPDAAVQGHYQVFSRREQLTYDFAPSPDSPGQGPGWHLVAIRNGNGQAIRFAYSAAGHLLGITDSADRRLGVRTDAAGRILALDLPHPDGAPGTFAAVQYAYEEAGNLVAATDAEGHSERFAYEPFTNLLTTRTFRNDTSFCFTYDAQRRCTHTWSAEGYLSYRFAYGEGHTVATTDTPATRQEYWHAQGLVTHHLDPVGSRHEWYYNAYGELELTRDPLGQATLFDYDAAGNLVATTRPGGITEQTRYNAQGRPVAAITAAGGQWQWYYAAAGQLAARTDPTGATTAYAYDEQGRLAAITDALGHTTRLRYDAQHNLTHVVAPDDSIRSRAYDALGRLVALTDARGHVQQRRYDRLGQLVALLEPTGETQQLTYDAMGHVVRANNGRQEVTYAYSPIGQLQARRQAGQQVAFGYNAEGQLTQVRNEVGETYQFELNAAGQVVEEVGFDGLRRRYERDAAGRVTQVRRPAGRTTTYAYDAAGQVAEVLHNGTEHTRYRYRPDGALLEAVTATTRVEFERDALGRVVCETQNGHEVHSVLDALGQRLGLTSSLGAAVQLERDALGQVRRTQAGAWQSVVRRDAEGLELHRQLSGGLDQEWQHDALGRPTSQRLSRRGQVARQRRYHWQAGDQLTQVEDSQQGMTAFTYDAGGSLAGATYADGSQDIRQPDAVGNLFGTRARTDRTYGPGGQLRTAGGTRYGYDAEGNLVGKTLPNGQQWRYTWDGAGQLVEVRRPDGYAVTFTYDALGRRMSKRLRGRVTKWVWDGDKPLHEWQELEIGPGAGSASEVLTWLFEDDSFAPLARLSGQGAQSVVCDHLGTPLTLHDEQGAVTWTLTLDSYGGVRQGRGKAQDCPFRYQGQYEDTETGLYYNRFRYYDPEAGRYISQDLIGLRGGQRLYAYTSNPIAQIDVLGLAGTPIVVIGEGQKAVDEATKLLRIQGHDAISMMYPKNLWKGGLLFDGMPAADFEKAVQWNKRWLATKIDQGYKIVDIGLDPGRASLSPFYQAEQEAISEKGVARIRLKKLPNGESVSEMRTRLGC